ncbi:DNA cytosine methyltransferase [Rhizobium leguminosarum]|uniref:DNA cytosine methyltransferase n=1 Tax=Rhizobium leguminosarum TaxID=384 RepID=UPI001C93AD37|nr:DNA cytosine methyltransferase [Rhizobium leguminosarum]MBY5524060.1 DNA cytosine methyltransferase [Rhizobium leguminosarum]
MKIEAVDLFCGVGGLSAGLRLAGIDVRAGIDLDTSCKYAYEKNINAAFLTLDVAELSGADIIKLYSPDAKKVLVGCAPCQPFSMYTGRYRQNETAQDTDKRWNMLREFARIIEEVQPDVVSMENVPRVAVHPAFNSFVARLEAAGYKVTFQKVRAQNYGVPQRRTRLVLFASKFEEIELAEPTHENSPVTVRDAISSLPPIKAGEVHAGDRLHQSRNLGETNLRRIRATREGGSWKDWDESLQLACHRKPGGKSFRAVYGRMNWDEPSPVITTQCLGIGNGRFGHPEQDRAISIREAAVLQSFPVDFEFVAPDERVNQLRLARQIGNAVPVKLGEAVARSIKRHLDQHQKS